MGISFLCSNPFDCGLSGLLTAGNMLILRCFDVSSERHSEMEPVMESCPFLNIISVRSIVVEVFIEIISTSVIEG